MWNYGSNVGDILSHIKKKYPPLWIKKDQNILSIKIENVHEILSHRINLYEKVSFMLDQIRVLLYTDWFLKVFFHLNTFKVNQNGWFWI